MAVVRKGSSEISVLGSDAKQKETYGKALGVFFKRVDQFMMAGCIFCSGQFLQEFDSGMKRIIMTIYEFINTLKSKPIKRPKALYTKYHYYHQRCKGLFFFVLFVPTLVLGWFLLFLYINYHFHYYYCHYYYYYHYYYYQNSKHES